MTKTDVPLVLVVDDEERFLSYVLAAAENVLHEKWMKARSSADLFKCLDEYKDRIFAILLDWDLGGELSGVPLIEEIQRVAKHRTVIYVLSEKIDVEEEKAAVDAGAYCRFKKYEDPERIRIYTSRNFVLRLIRRQNTDELTGLLNFSTFTVLSKAELEAAYARQDEKHPKVFSMLFLDMNEFKKINDVHGHAIGDEAIKKVAQTLRERVRPADHPARMAKGDEFVALLPDADELLAEKIRLKIKRAVSKIDIHGLDGARIPLSVAIGCSTIRTNDIGPNAGLAFRELLHKADVVMYEDKHPKTEG